MPTFKGFKSPVVGNTKILYDIDLINADLMNHFMTMKGERVMDADYGFIGWDMLFDLKTQYNKVLLENDVVRIIATEPRVQMIDMQVQEYEHGFTVAVVLEYHNIGTDRLEIAFDESMVEKQR